MFKLIVAPIVKAEVKGSLTDENGRAVPFDFSLIAKRERAEDLEQTLQADNDTSIREYMTKRVEDWQGVLDSDGKPLPFSADGLTQLFAFPGMPQLCFRSYLAAVSVQGRQKN